MDWQLVEIKIYIFYFTIVLILVLVNYSNPAIVFCCQVIHVWNKTSKIGNNIFSAIMFPYRCLIH